MPDRPEVSIDEREALVQAFRASDDGAPFATDQGALDIVSFAIDFCADYVDGRPLRWSPVVVELFMADWLPRKVLAEREVFERVPEVLPAWIRHAGRLRDIPADAIEATVAAVDKWTETMLGALDEEESFLTGQAVHGRGDGGRRRSIRPRRRRALRQRLERRPRFPLTPWPAAWLH